MNTMIIGVHGKGLYWTFMDISSYRILKTYRPGQPNWHSYCYKRVSIGLTRSVFKQKRFLPYSVFQNLPNLIWVILQIKNSFIMAKDVRDGMLIVSRNKQSSKSILIDRY